MKLQHKILVLLLMVSMSAMATDPEKKETVAKILPSGKAGLLKILYVNPDEKQVRVNFYDENGLLFKEKVSDNRFKKGFIKFYDLTTLKDGKYWVEIADAEMSVKYELTLTKNIIWVNYWNNYLPDGEIVAAR